VKQIYQSISIAAFVAAASPAYAEETKVSGGTFISIQDTTPSRCINASTDLMSVTLATVQIQRSKSWLDSIFKETTSLGAKFDVEMANSEGKKFVFPRAIKISSPRKESDIAILPINVPIMSKYNLVSEGKFFNDVNFSISFIKIEDKSAEFKAFNSLIKFSEKLPLPPNPYVQGVGYFGEFANLIVGQSIGNGDKLDPDAIFGGIVAENKPQADLCPSGALKTGVQAVIYDYTGSPNSTSNLISIHNSENYCFWIKGPSVVYADKNGKCNASPVNTSKRLDNPMVVFIINAWPKSVGSKGSGASLAGSLKPSAMKLIQPQAKSLFLSSQADNNAITDSMAQDIANLSNALSSDSSLKDSEKSKAIGDATDLETSAILAARRCSLAGIDLSDCN
jgi:hypothetical protein